MKIITVYGEYSKWGIIPIEGLVLPLSIFTNSNDVFDIKPRCAICTHWNKDSKRFGYCDLINPEIFSSRSGEKIIRRVHCKYSDICIKYEPPTTKRFEVNILGDKILTKEDDMKR